MSIYEATRRCCRVGVLLVLSLCLCLGTVSSLRAQNSSTGALTGTITDSSGAVVPNAAVTITSADTGQTRTAMTGADGTFRFGLLPPSNYDVKIVATGFEPMDVPAATVTVTETAVLNRVLQVGTQSQTVTVEGSVETIQTTSSALGTVASAKTVAELPLNTRNYTNLLTMSAGANSSVQDASQVGKGSTFIAVNGSGFGQNTYMQDGVDVDSWFSFNTGADGLSAGSFAIPNPDAIAEFKIQTSSYDASYGRNPGANVNVVTKSGTNNFHGSGFEFFRNTALNANSWFNNSHNTPKGVLNSNQYGGTFGGPVKKDKLFFFVSYQETWQKNGITAYGNASSNLPPIPDGDRGTCPVGFTSLSQCSAAGQTFIGNLDTAMCPGNKASNIASAYQTNKNSGIQVQCAPGSNLGNINPVAISILQLKLPGGNGYLVPSPATSNCNSLTNGYSNCVFTDPALFKDHNAIGNFDYVINAKHTLSGRYQYENDPLYGNFGVQNSTQAAGNFLPGEPVTATHLNQNGILKLTSILSPNLVNQANVAYQRIVSVNSSQTPYTNSQVGITSLDPALDNLAFVTVTGDFMLGAMYQYGTYNPVNQFQWNDELSWTHGKHTIRTGVGIEHVQAKTFFPGHSTGNPTFSTFSDFLIGLPSCQAFTGTGTCGTGNPGAVNGLPQTNGTSASNINSVGTFTALNATFSGYWHVNEFNMFIQDDYQVRPRLTLNLGLRWEYDGDVTESQGLQSTMWPSLMNTVPLPGTAAAAGTLAGLVVPANYPGPLLPGMYKNTNDSINQPAAPWTDFGPRIGFAWQPTGSSKWVWRGGGGLFYDVMPGNTILNIQEVTAPSLLPVVSPPPLGSLSNPFQLPTVVYAGPPGTAGFATRWVNPATNGSSNLSGAVIQQDMNVPVTYEWNLNTQYEFIHDWVLEVAYVGSHGIHQAPQSRAGLQGQASTQVGYNVAPLAGPNCTSCALTGVSTNTVANVPLRVPYLGMSASDSALETNANYKFNSLQVTVRKQLSHGFQLQAAYTFSRGFITQPFGYNDYPYVRQSYEPNNNYHPQRVVFNYLWNLPTGNIQGFARKVLEGWSWSGVTTIQNGVPLTITDTGGSIFFGGQGSLSTAQFCPGMTAANLLTTGSMDSRVTNGYLNGYNQGVLCTPPAIGNGLGFGNLGGGIVLGPGQFNWDMALAKLVNIRESQSLQFRAEFFNTFNHPQFASPNLAANTGTFGQITATSVNPRVIQLALKYSF